MLIRELTWSCFHFKENKISKDTVQFCGGNKHQKPITQHKTDKPVNGHWSVVAQFDLPANVCTLLFILGSG